MTVLSAADFDAFGSEHVEDWAKRGPGVSGLVAWREDGSYHCYLHEADGIDVGAIIHETVHVYSSRALGALCKPLAEAVTEFFARQVLAEIAPQHARGAYSEGCAVVTRLVAALGGETELAAAYFGGATDALAHAFGAIAADDWAVFIGHCAAGQWANATMCF